MTEDSGLRSCEMVMMSWCGSVWFHWCCFFCQSLLTSTFLVWTTGSVRLWDSVLLECYCGECICCYKTLLYCTKNGNSYAFHACVVILHLCCWYFVGSWDKIWFYIANVFWYVTVLWLPVNRVHTECIYIYKTTQQHTAEGGHLFQSVLCHAKFFVRS